MQRDDPANKNKLILGEGLEELYENYLQAIKEGASSTSPEAFGKTVELLKGAGISDKRVFFAGNGGSTSISDHACCDLIKSTFIAGQFKINAQSLNANTPLLTAIANDYGYENVFSFQLEVASKPGDLIFLVSSSGNSPNIKAALDFAKSAEVTVVGLSGFDGGYLRQNADISLHVEAQNYGIIEDAHMQLIHLLAQEVRNA